MSLKKMTSYQMKKRAVKKSMSRLNIANIKIRLQCLSKLFRKIKTLKLLFSILIKLLRNRQQSH